ncbi:hypothetical protein L227DRAFT_89531 [Lentinus tigrinus ALCF2SS1-6]|uniref:Uncharacterized protein n=1 Tax=Lentinus tigrinus ALCF2SS1-6 TaxID=1328759 RepID=A0A5C2S9Q0_9APHY|nr:hypothetical protein L227DRAFT_89531 [Lentinus tigrinus ALCF2SS1-6]
MSRSMSPPQNLRQTSCFTRSPAITQLPNREVLSPPISRRMTPPFESSSLPRGACPPDLPASHSHARAPQCCVPRVLSVFGHARWGDINVHVEYTREARDRMAMLSPATVNATRRIHDPTRLPPTPAELPTTNPPIATWCAKPRSSTAPARFPISHFHLPSPISHRHRPSICQDAQCRAAA